MLSWNDEPVRVETADLLGTFASADALAAKIVDVVPPFIVGVHGDWGTGKTSILRRLELQVAGVAWSRNQKCFPVFFEAWRYQREPDPAVALLQAIRRDVQAPPKHLADAVGWIKKLTAVTASAAVNSLDLVALGLPTGVVGAARQAGEAWEQAQRTLPLDTDRLRELFAAAVTRIVGKDGRLVVLIDDLDRCSDEATVRLLEALKLHFSTTNVVFVVAADRRAIERAAAQVLFKEVAESLQPLVAAEYCEKLFQAAWSMPGVDVSRLVTQLWVDDTREAVGKAAKAASELVAKHRLLPPNPRKAKRWLWELTRRWDEHRRRYPGNEADLELLVTVQAIETYHPRVYSVLADTGLPFWNRLQEQIVSPTPVGAADQHDALLGLRFPGRTALNEQFPDPGDGRVAWWARALGTLKPMPDALDRALFRAPGPK